MRALHLSALAALTLTALPGLTYGAPSGPVPETATRPTLAESLARFQSGDISAIAHLEAHYRLERGPLQRLALAELLSDVSSGALTASRESYIEDVFSLHRDLGIRIPESRELQLLQIVADEAFADGRIERAQETYRKILAKTGGESEHARFRFYAFYKLGWTYLSDSRPARALELWIPLIRKGDENELRIELVRDTARAWVEALVRRKSPATASDPGFPFPYELTVDAHEREAALGGAVMAFRREGAKWISPALLALSGTPSEGPLRMQLSLDASLVGLDACGFLDLWTPAMLRELERATVAALSPEIDRCRKARPDARLIAFLERAGERKGTQRLALVDLYARNGRTALACQESFHAVREQGAVTPETFASFADLCSRAGADALKERIEWLWTAPAAVEFSRVHPDHWRSAWALWSRNPAIRDEIRSALLSRPPHSAVDAALIAELIEPGFSRLKQYIRQESVTPSPALEQAIAAEAATIASGAAARKDPAKDLAKLRTALELLNDRQSSSWRSLAVRMRVHLLSEGAIAAPEALLRAFASAARGGASTARAANREASGGGELDAAIRQWIVLAAASSRWDLLAADWPLVKPRIPGMEAVRKAWLLAILDDPRSTAPADPAVAAWLTPALLALNEGDPQSPGSVPLLTPSEMAGIAAANPLLPADWKRAWMRWWELRQQLGEITPASWEALPVEQLGARLERLRKLVRSTTQEWPAGRMSTALRARAARAVRQAAEGIASRAAQDEHEKAQWAELSGVIQTWAEI